MGIVFNKKVGYGYNKNQCHATFKCPSSLMSQSLTVKFMHISLIPHRLSITVMKFEFLYKIKTTVSCQAKVHFTYMGDC